MLNLLESTWLDRTFCVFEKERPHRSLEAFTTSKLMLKKLKETDKNVNNNKIATSVGIVYYETQIMRAQHNGRILGSFPSS